MFLLSNLDARARRRGRRGTGLVDAMLGVLVLSTSVISSLALFQSSAQQTSRSSQFTRAATLCRRKLDQLRGMSPTETNLSYLVNSGILDSSTPNAAGEYSFTQADGVASELSGGTGVITVSNLGSDLVTLRVRIRWTSGTQQREASATSYISQKTPWVEPAL